MGARLAFHFRSAKLRDMDAQIIVVNALVFLLGAGLGWLFFHYTELFPKKTSLLEAMLFLGASMCITAFPMLARIMNFKNLNGTTMGTVAIGAGAIDDATAWCLLAVVLASFDNDWSHALVNIGGGLGYVTAVLVVVRPLLALCVFLARVVDLGLIDGAVNGLGRAVLGWAQGLRRIQTGYVVNYALTMLLGVVALIGFVLAR